MALGESARVGVIGLGGIGAGVARSLARAHVNPVMVWARTPETRAIWAKSSDFAATPPRQMAGACDVVFLAVPGMPEVKEILEGADGMLAHARRGLLLVDLTTSNPDSTRRLAAAARAHDVDYLDAGTSGGPAKADRGELLLMVGGDEDVFERSRPFLNSIAAESFLVGPSGAGHTLKLLHNNVTFGTFLLTCEAGRVAERAGIPLARMIEIFNQSNARSYASEVRFPQHVLSETWDSRGRIDLVYRDICLGAELNESYGLSLGLVEAARDFLALAVARGMARDDFMLLYRDYEAILAAPKSGSAVSIPARGS